MQKLAKIFWIAALAGCGAGGAAAVHAGEPFSEMTARAAPAGLNARAAISVTRLQVNRLDLAAPTLSLASRQKIPDSFLPSDRHVEVGGDSSARFSFANAGNRVPGSAEQLVRNFHRDGLPLARLFQSENSLVHLGLNQKGKPGLWIIEKIH